MSSEGLNKFLKLKEVILANISKEAKIGQMHKKSSSNKPSDLLTLSKAP